MRGARDDKNAREIEIERKIEGEEDREQKSRAVDYFFGWRSFFRVCLDFDDDLSSFPFKFRSNPAFVFFPT